jgi:hypothetical protein
MYVLWCVALCIRVNMLVYRIDMVCVILFTFCINGALTADRTLPYQILQACTAPVPVGRACRAIPKIQLGPWCRTPSPIYVILPAISWHELYSPTRSFPRFPTFNPQCVHCSRCPGGASLLARPGARVRHGGSLIRLYRLRNRWDSILAFSM